MQYETNTPLKAEGHLTHAEDPDPPRSCAFHGSDCALNTSLAPSHHQFHQNHNIAPLSRPPFLSTFSCLTISSVRGLARPVAVLLAVLPDVPAVRTPLAVAPAAVVSATNTAVPNAVPDPL